MEPNIMEAIGALKTALASPSNEVLAKAGYAQPATAITGLQGYDLEAPAKKLYPVNAPLRNRIPRVGLGYGIQANWRAVTDINTNRMLAGVSEGNRNEAIATSVAEYLAAYRGIGMEHSVTFEAGYAAAGFDDLRARAQREALESLILQEERLLIGGNGSAGLALGVPTGLAGADSATGGEISDAAVYAYVVALTMEGVFGTTSTAIPTVLARTTANGVAENVNAGSSNKSAEASVTGMTGSTNKIVWTWDAVDGAVAYALFVGDTTGAANCKFIGSLVYTNTWTQTKDVSTYAANQAASAITADSSQNALAFDGILTQLFKAGVNIYDLDGASLTSDGAGGIEEIEQALEDMFSTYQLAVDEIWIPGVLARDVTASILDSGTAPAMRVDLTQNGIVGGIAVPAYLNRFMGGTIPIKIHPYLPAGIVLGLSFGLPYPMNEVPSVWRVKERQSYYSIEWPLVSRKYEFGVYADEVLQGYAPFANFVLRNVGRR